MAILLLFLTAVALGAQTPASTTVRGRILITAYPIVPDQPPLDAGELALQLGGTTVAASALKPASGPVEFYLAIDDNTRLSSTG